ELVETGEQADDIGCRDLHRLRFPVARLDAAAACGPDEDGIDVETGVTAAAPQKRTCERCVAAAEGYDFGARRDRGDDAPPSLDASCPLEQSHRHAVDERAAVHESHGAHAGDRRLYQLRSATLRPCLSRSPREAAATMTRLCTARLRRRKRTAS